MVQSMLRPVQDNVSYPEVVPGDNSCFQGLSGAIYVEASAR